MINKLVLVPCKYTQKTGSNNFLAKKIAWRQGTFCIFLFFFPRIVGKNRKDCIIFAAWNPETPENPENPENQ
jgi:hypothetical protein